MWSMWLSTLGPPDLISFAFVMLQSIEIENFRCFHRSRLENFGQVNLIGGMNNAGKTALLEALLLGSVPTFESIGFLQVMRGEIMSQYHFYPSLAWGNLFFKQDKSSVIRIRSNYMPSAKVDVEIACTEYQHLDQPEDGDPNINGGLIKIVDSASLMEVSKSALTISAESPQGRTNNQFDYSKTGEFVSVNSPLLDYQPFQPIHKTVLIPTGFKPSSTMLAIGLSQETQDGNAASITEVFKIIDDSIEKVETTFLGNLPCIYVFRKGEKAQPLNFFGDALNKITDLILRVVNNPNCILLIDEIENGIHHTNQQEFWRMLIKLAVQKNVQIFATSHSAEMIGAFQAAAVEDQQEDKVRYITLYRSARTGEIIGAQRDMETLGYNLRTDNPYRGE